MPTSTYQAADLPGELADFAPLLMLDDGAQDPGVDDAYRLRLHDYWFAAIGAAGDLISTSSHFGLPGGHSLVEEMFGAQSDARLAGDQVTTLAGGQMGVGQLPAERSSARTDHLDALRPQTGVSPMALPPLDPAGAGEVIDEEELAREQAKRERLAEGVARNDAMVNGNGQLRVGSSMAVQRKEFVEELYRYGIELLEDVPILGTALNLYQAVTGQDLGSMDPNAELTTEQRLLKGFFVALDVLPVGDLVAAGGRGVMKTARRVVGASDDVVKHGARRLDDVAGGVGIVARQGDGVVSATRSRRVAAPGTSEINPMARVHARAHGHSVRNVNPKGYLDNCGSCVIATDATLRGNAASAINTGRVSWQSLERHFNSKWQQQGLRGAKRELLEAGSGASGVMAGFFRHADGTIDAHVFNIVNQRGVIRLLDGQIGRALTSSDLERYIGYWFMRTG